jgi:hypothetical protein
VGDRPGEARVVPPPEADAPPLEEVGVEAGVAQAGAQAVDPPLEVGLMGRGTAE